MISSYQQPLGDAIGITLTAVLFTVLSLALARNVGNVRTSMSQDVADRNSRAPWRWLLLGRRNREYHTDVARVDATHRLMAWIGVGIGLCMLLIEFTAVAVNGLR